MANKKQSTEQALADRPAPKFDGKYVQHDGSIVIARSPDWDETRQVWCYVLHSLGGGMGFPYPETSLRLAVGDAEVFTVAMHRRKTELAKAEARVVELKREIEAMETTMRIIGEEPDAAPA